MALVLAWKFDATVMVYVFYRSVYCKSHSMSLLVEVNAAQNVLLPGLRNLRVHRNLVAQEEAASMSETLVLVAVEALVVLHQRGRGCWDFLCFLHLYQIFSVYNN